MKSFKSFFSYHKRTLYALLAVFLFSTTVMLAVFPTSPYVLGNASNGITSFFSKKVTIEELCVDTGDNVRCITKE